MEKDPNRVAGGQKSSEGGRGDPNKSSPAAIERYLKGVHFPATKNDLMAKAKENNVPSDVVSILNRFDDSREFQSVIEIAKEVGRVE